MNEKDVAGTLERVKRKKKRGKGRRPNERGRRRGKTIPEPANRVEAFLAGRSGGGKVGRGCDDGQGEGDER
jgi:hypothetical protein